MKALWNKLVTLTRWFKVACKDELWLVCLILSLVFLASANIVQLTQRQRDVTELATQKPAMIDLAQQDMTAKEVQVIVSKPIKDLMAMQVYDKTSRAQNSGELVAQSQDMSIINVTKSGKKVNRFNLATTQLFQAWSL